MKSRVEELMTRHPKTVRASEALDAVARLMWEHDIGCVPIVDDRERLAGMITDRDIAMAAFTQGRRLAEINAFTAMASRPAWVNHDDDVGVAMERMRQAKVRRLPVIDSDWRVIGLIAMCDLIREATPEGGGVTDRAVIETLQQIVKPHIARELERRPRSLAS